MTPTHPLSSINTAACFTAAAVFIAINGYGGLEFPTGEHGIIGLMERRKLPAGVKGALVLFTLVGGVAVWVLPYASRIFGTSDQPNLIQLALTGIVLILLTAPLLNYAAKAIGLNQAWFILALVYNSLIIVIKFFLSPLSLYLQTIDLNVAAFNPNGGAFLYLLAAALVFLIYAVIFAIIYRISRRKAKGAILSAPSAPAEGHRLGIGITIILVIGLLVLGSMTGFIFLPLFFGLTALSYLSEVFSTGLLVFVLIAVGFAIWAAFRSFEAATETAINMKDATILAVCFWLGFSLILIYHVLWVIYMSVMASIWPFKVILPSGK